METDMRDPFHPGERAIQEQTGEREVALMNGRLIGDRIPAAARLFVAQQHYCALGWSSPEHELWAAFLGGPQGFAHTDEDGSQLNLRLDDIAGVLSRIPPFAGVEVNDHLGVLFIELATRRRLRASGRCAHKTATELAISIDEAHPLCPKYIQRRQLEDAAPGGAPSGIQEGEALSTELVAWITGADTFFVASSHPDRSADISHRGGKPGFVRHDGGVLRIPDYPGNGMFNTLGNFMLNPRAGLTFVDFGANRQLQMTGEVSLDLDAGTTEGGTAGGTGGTGRWWEFRPRKWIVAPLNRAFEWKFIDQSQFNP
jgi:uncharacterized protein